MEDKLLINEVAKLVGISSHTIRYYDKEGLISSSYNDSGYRNFDLSDISKLLNIMILRESGISIKNIKKLIDGYSIEEYQKYLEIAEKVLDNELLKIMNKKKIIGETLDKIKNRKIGFSTEFKEKRCFQLINEIGYEEKINSRLYYNIFLEKKIKNITYKNLIYKLEKNTMKVFIEDDKGDYNLEKGNYLEYNFIVNSEEEIGEHIKKYYKNIEKNNLQTENDIYILIESHSMLITAEGYEIQMFSKIKS